MLRRRTSLLPIAALAVAVLGATAAPLLLRAAIYDMPIPDLDPPTGTLVLDRNITLLRPFTVADGRWRLAVDRKDVDPAFVETLIAYEDRRFRSHGGVDLRAVARAALQFITHGRAVSGASTISMQVARLLDGGTTRSPDAKLRQIMLALALERRAGKDAILDLYLRLAPYGGNIEGVRAASLAYFGKEPRRLNPAEAALLVALPQAPEARRPDRHPSVAERARARVLRRAEAAGVYTEDDVAAALTEPVPTARRPFPMLAAHTASRLVTAAPGKPIHRLTLDGRIQASLEALAAERARAIDPGVSVAILVADHRSGEVLASVGSSGLFDQARDGFVDMTRAVRSPGSAVKPLIYGLAFEEGVAHPESLIEDRPVAYAGYQPENFDRIFHGTVTVRRALQLSLNVPAIQLLDAVGPARLVARMRRAGVVPVLSDLSPPGLAVGLGGLGVTLTDLVAIEAAIARGGTAVRLRLAADVPAEARGQPARVLGERAAWYVASILAGAAGPSHVSPGTIAFKTGTSYGYRDAWAIGFDGAHVVGVWAGRPDGTPVPGLVGIDAAAPVMMDAFARLGPATPLRAAPPGVLQASTSSLPATLRNVRVPGREIGRTSAPEIAFPPSGVRLDLGLKVGAAEALVLKARNGRPPYIWLADGAPVARAGFGRSAAWTPAGPGYVRLTVIDADGAASTVGVYLE